MERLIVLADDDPDIRSVYAGALRHAGYQVIEASDGIEAVALVHQWKPELLLLDVWMPAVNGFEVLDMIRYSPDLATMKVVMLSNLDDAESRLESFSGGVHDYWVKGISLREFLDRVKRTLDDDSPVAEPR
ncbi:MAG: PleD family two-component system response regulator [Isosphaeraceae bacterium]